MKTQKGNRTEKMITYIGDPNKIAAMFAKAHKKALVDKASLRGPNSRTILVRSF